MEITLNKDWDNLPSGQHSPSPYFSGRTQELEHLKHIILNKISGSVLLAAPRGIGKTDLAYKAVSEAVSKNSSIIPVVFNATQLGYSGDKPDLPQSILENLISRTYTACRNRADLTNEQRAQISSLYLQATAKIYEKSYESLSEDKEISQDDITNEIITKGWISFSKKDLIDAIRKHTPPISVIIAGSVGLLGNIPFEIKAGIMGILALITIMVDVVDFGAERAESRKETKGKSKERGIIESAQTKYLTDKSFGNLEFGLKEFLGSLHRSKDRYKVVFIIDELDKLDLEPSAILNVIKSFKGLLNHSDALFVFIADDNVFREVDKSRQGRDVNSTLFNQRIYVNRPTIPDLKEYLRKIIKSPRGKSTEDFEHYITYVSQMDFYQIPDNIRDHVTKFVNEAPVIEWEANDVNLQKVNKQRIIGALLEEGVYLYKQQSNKPKNDVLISAAYEVANSVEPFEIPIQIDSSDPEQKVALQLKADLAKYLYHSEIFQRAKMDKEGTEIFTYTPTNSTGMPINTLSEPLEFEKELIGRFKELERFILQIYNFRADFLSQNKTKDVTDEVVAEVARISGFLPEIHKGNKELLDHLTANPSEHNLGQEEIKTFINQINNHVKDVLKNNGLLILKNTLEEIKIPVWNLLESKDILDMLPTLRDYIQSNSIINILLRNESTGRTVIFLLNPPDTLANNKAILDELKADNKTYIVEVYTEIDKFPNISKDRSNRFEAIFMDEKYLSSKEVKTILRSFLNRK